MKVRPSHIKMSPHFPVDGHWLPVTIVLCCSPRQAQAAVSTAAAGWLAAGPR